MLTSMHRHVTKQETINLLKAIRERVPGIHIRTTLMVGFPGETDEDFHELLDFVREQRFERMGAFAYSEEEGTYSATHYEDNVPAEVKQRRLDELMILQQDISSEIEALRPYNPTYDGWWTHDTLPKLNYEGSGELYDYVLKVAQKWVSAPYNVDGWRLDVAADLGHSNEFNHQFWKDFRKAVKEANPEALILAEHYGSPEGWLQGDEWDSVMNYDAFMEPVTWFLTGMEKHSDEYREDLYGNSDAFIGAMKTHMRSLHMSSLHTAMNECSRSPSRNDAAWHCR